MSWIGQETHEKGPPPSPIKELDIIMYYIDDIICGLNVFQSVILLKDRITLSQIFEGSTCESWPLSTPFWARGPLRHGRSTRIKGDGAEAEAARSGIRVGEHQAIPKGSTK